MSWLIALIGTMLAAACAVFYKKYSPPEDPEMPSLDNQPVVAEVVPNAIAPKPTLPAPIGPKMRLDTLCDAIATFEGANPANRNRGNCRCSPVGYLPKYGKVLCNPHGFAVFPTDALGDEYLHELVHHRVMLNPRWDFYDFFSNYAPSTDNNQPRVYAEFVAAHCKVIPSMAISHYLAGVA